MDGLGRPLAPKPPPPPQQQQQQEQQQQQHAQPSLHAPAAYAAQPPSQQHFVVQQPYPPQQQQQQTQTQTHQQQTHQQQTHQQQTQQQVAAPAAAAAARKRTDEEQAISLKVMRLYKPRLDEPGPGLGVGVHDTRIWTQGSAGHLLLPVSFGKIYIGQMFSCYISACNNGHCAQVNNLTVLVELESSAGRIVLPDKREKRDSSAGPFGVRAVAEPGVTVDKVVQHELSATGQHTLRVNVQCDSSQPPGRRSVRKHYRFDVGKPLSFNASFKALPGSEAVVAGSGVLGASRLVAQVRVRNLAETDLLLAHLEMIPMDDKNFQAHQIALAPVKGGSVAKPILLRPGDTRNFLFSVEPQPGASPGAALLPGSQVARLLTRWTTDFSEQGRLMSQPFVWRHKAPAAEAGIVVRMSSPPRGLHVGGTAELRFEVINLLEHDVDAELALDSHQGAAGAGVLLVGTTAASLGVLRPHEAREAACKAVALAPGLHQLHGVRVRDRRTSREFSPPEPPALLVSQSRRAAPPA